MWLIGGAVTTVFPARAGMIPAADGRDPLEYGIPRESGDDPTPKVFNVTATEYSPRERG